MKEKTIGDIYVDLAGEFHEENEGFLCDVEKIMESVFRNKNPRFPFAIDVVLALHNFDVKHANQPHSRQLKSSIVDIDNNEPITFHERVNELSLIAYSLEGTSHWLIIDVALALHGNRIINNNFNALPDFNKIDEPEDTFI